MPCNSDYMEPTVRENQRRQAARLLVYISDAIGQKLSTVGFRRQAKDPYGNITTTSSDRAMIELCHLMYGLSEDQMNKHVYDGRIPEARELASWWEQHTAEDRKREAAEALRRRQDELVESALAKLTPEEREAVVNSMAAFA